MNTEDAFCPSGGTALSRCLALLMGSLGVLGCASPDAHDHDGGHEVEADASYRDQSTTDGRDGAATALPSCETAAARGLDLCRDEGDRCEIVFEDYEGCRSACASIGRVCVESFDNDESACAAAAVPLFCEPTDHQSDYCVCGRGAALPDGGTRDGSASDMPAEPPVLKAFPTAYGAGAHASGGRGGDVYHVTNLNDRGAGSLREGLTESKRTIVFDVSGTIELTSALVVQADELTIAGQSAPPGGITITGRSPFFELNGSDNLIVRYVRFRPEYFVEVDNRGLDALNVQNVTNAIFDHVSVSWGGDEAFSLVGDSHDVTVQHSIIAESKKAMIAGAGESSVSDDISLLQNVYYNAGYRFPLVAAQHVESINNVAHNWTTRLCIVGSPNPTRFSEINNYYQRGAVGENVLDPTVARGNWLDDRFDLDIQIYTEGNVVDGVLGPGDDNWDLYLIRTFTPGPWPRPSLSYRSSLPLPLLGEHPYPIKSAAEALEDAIAHAGASSALSETGESLPNRDALDVAYMAHVRNGTWERALDDDIVNQERYRQWHAAVTSTPIDVRPPTYDSDRDGMADAWERARGLDPSRADHNGDDDGDGYTNLEEFLNSVDR